jgi:hypothetical protein
MALVSNERNLEELKNLVVKTLQTNGVLGEIRAQLRANVYKAIDSEESDQGLDANGASSVKLNKSNVGRLMVEIVAEFFEFYKFRHSLSVFLPEANLGRERRSRAEVALDAGLARVLSDSSVLEQLMGLAASYSDHQKGGISSASSTTASSPPPGARLPQASTRPSATTESIASKSDGDTPPDRSGDARGAASTGERSRHQPSPTAIASAISAGIGNIGSNSGNGGYPSNGGSGAVDFSAPGNEACRPDSGVSEDEVCTVSNAQRKKLLGKLPSLGSGGKDTFPSIGGNNAVPASSSVVGGGAAVVGHEEVSLADSAHGGSRDSLDEVRAAPPRDSLEEVREDMLRLQQIDNQIARLSRTSGSGRQQADSNGNHVDSPSTSANGGIGVAAAGRPAAVNSESLMHNTSVSGHESSLQDISGGDFHSDMHSDARSEGSAGSGGAHSLPRSADESRSPAASAASPVGSTSRSASAGMASPSEGRAGLHTGQTPLSAGRVACKTFETPEGGTSADADNRKNRVASATSSPEHPNDDDGSISVEDSVGSGSLDLTGAGPGTGDLASGNSSILGPRRGADGNAAAAHNQDADGAGEIEEDILEEDGSIEGYQSEANSSDGGF